MATAPQGTQGQPRFGPSDGLIAMFRAGSRDPSGAIQTRLKRMMHTFLQHHRDNAKDLATKCCCESGIWYYRILENLMSQERKRLGIRDISVILEDELFQRCLVACCLEITVFSNLLPCDFPLLLQILKLAPYHFLKVIELVLRAEEGLSRAVVRHFAQVEVKVLESLAWTSNSPLWEQIRANGSHLPTCQQVMLPSQLEDPKRTDFQPDREQPGEDNSLGEEQSASSDQRRSPSAGNGPRRSTALHVFARKLYSLMGKRLRALCSMLDISDELRLKIWTCFEYSLVHCTDLMVDRHLDQLLMCSIYIIAKITKVEIPFKHIMNCYKSQPLASKSVCKNVLMSGRDGENELTGNNNHEDYGVPTPNTPSMHCPGPCQEERGNLIHFYNRIFTTKMQHFAEQFAPTSGRDTPPLSPYPQQWRASSRRRRLSSSYSIYVSQWDTQTASPRTPGLCYYFNSSPPEILRKITNMVSRGRPPSRRGYVVSLERGEEDEGEGKEEEEEEEGRPAKRLRLDDQSAWQRRLRNVVNDRVTRRDPDRPSPVTTRDNLH